jgi:hypothetical protein
MAQKAPTKSPEALAQDALDLACNALILEPELPAAILAEHILAEADSDLVRDLGRILLAQHFVKLVKLLRAQQRSARPKPAPLFPEWAALPVRIVTPDGRASLATANATQLRAYLKILRERQEARIEGTQLRRRIEQVEALLALMRKHAAKKHGITVGEVAELEHQ